MTVIILMLIAFSVGYILGATRTPPHRKQSEPLRGGRPVK